MGDGHEIYVETSGNPDGIPAVFLHGGPGSGCHPGLRDLFDPDRVRLILYDQRGAGRSTPKPGLAHNTTDHLIADLEVLRRHFDVDSWLVVGGSWGATLALAYAEAHPRSVRGLALRAVFLGTQRELDTAFCETLPRFHPALHDDFLRVLPPADRDAPLDAYWARILDPDPAVHRPAIRAWYTTERALSQLAPGPARIDRANLDDPTGSLPATPLMEAHYFRADCFLKDRPILDNTDKLGGIPGRLVQGRYDLLCPPATSHALAARWPDARVIDVPDAGHTLNDGGTAAALRAAIAELAV